MVDQEIPRKGLGCGAVTYVFYASANFARSPTNNGTPAVGGSAGPAIGGPEPATSGSLHLAIGGPEPAIGGSVQLATGGPEPAIGGSVHTPLPADASGLKRTFSDPASPPHEEPNVKRRRLMLDTLIRLRDRVKTAAADNQWTAASPWNTNNVKYLIAEMLQVLDGIAQDTGFVQGAKTIEKVANFIGSIFMEHPSYLHLRHFENVFSALREKGVVVSAQRMLVENPTNGAH